MRRKRHVLVIMSCEAHSKKNYFQREREREREKKKSESKRKICKGLMNK